MRGSILQVGDGVPASYVRTEPENLITVPTANA